MKKETLSKASFRIIRAATAALLGTLAIALAACSSTANPTQVQSCLDEGRVLNAGFFAFFEPVSYSADMDPASPGFNNHLGYEADLLTALEEMEDSGLSFSRQGIAAWPDIWLRPAGAEFDIVGGGITILDSRTLDAVGQRVVTFTSGHILFRQSLLVRAADAQRIATHEDLTSDIRVGVLVGTTGESRLLELTGLASADGALAEGARLETSGGRVVADGTSNYFITAAGASPNVSGRKRLHPPLETMPQVVYFAGGDAEAAMLDALDSGQIDAVGRGEVGNRQVTAASGGAYAVTALDAATETGGFTLAAVDAELASCIDDRLNWLTDDQRIGYAEWLDDPSVFLRRAQLWNQGMR